MEDSRHKDEYPCVLFTQFGSKNGHTITLASQTRHRLKWHFWTGHARSLLFESLRLKPLHPESTQIIGSESASWPHYPQRLVIGLVLIRLLASGQSIAGFHQIYQGNKHNSHPALNLPSGKP